MLGHQPCLGMLGVGLAMVICAHRSMSKECGMAKWIVSNLEWSEQCVLD